MPRRNPPTPASATETRQQRDVAEQVDIEARETVAADELPEVDTASAEDDLEIALEAHATEEIVGDVDGDDYRAGTLDPEGSDRGPWSELSGDRLDHGLDRGDKRW